MESGLNCLPYSCSKSTHSNPNKLITYIHTKTTNGVRFWFHTQKHISQNENRQTKMILLSQSGVPKQKYTKTKDMEGTEKGQE